MQRIGRRLLISSFALALLTLGACEPCAGTSACESELKVSYTGHVVEYASRQSVARARVTFIRTGGVPLGTDTLVATTDRDGFFRLSSVARAEGEAIGTLFIASPGHPGYSVPGVALRTTRTAGDGGTLGRLVADPFVLFVGELRNRSALGGVTVASATVTFRRTGGIAADPEVIQTVTDIGGRFALAPRVTGNGVLEGTLTVAGPGLARTFQQPVRISTRYQDELVRDVTVVNIGGGIYWAGEVYRRVTNEHVAGLQVDFARTGGIAVSPDQFTTTTNAIGLFAIQPAALGEGELTGTVTVHPPAPWSTIVVPGVRVFTLESDSVRLATRIAFGAQAFGAIELWHRTTQSRVLTGGEIVVRRTGGVGALADTYPAQINAQGYAPVQFATTAAGELVADIEVRLGEPYGTDTLRGIRVKSAEDDIQRFLGTHAVGRWFPQVAHVADGETLKGIPGTRITFTREDGVRFSPDPYVVTPNADGYFALRPQPLADGEVVGTLTIELPAPYDRSTSIRGIHLLTSKDDTLRFVGTWLFTKPK